MAYRKKVRDGAVIFFGVVFIGFAVLHVSIGVLDADKTEITAAVTDMLALWLTVLSNELIQLKAYADELAERLRCTRASFNGAVSALVDEQGSLSKRVSDNYEAIQRSEILLAYTDKGKPDKTPPAASEQAQSRNHGNGDNR